MEWDIFHVIDGVNMKVQIRIIQREGNEVPGQQLMEKILRACPELTILRVSKETYDPACDVGQRWMFRLLNLLPATFYVHNLLAAGNFPGWEKRVEDFLISRNHKVQGWYTIEGDDTHPLKRGVYFDDKLCFYD